MFLYIIFSNKIYREKMREKNCLGKIQVLQKIRNIWIKIIKKGQQRNNIENEDKRVES